MKSLKVFFTVVFLLAVGYAIYRWTKKYFAKPTQVMPGKTGGGLSAAYSLPGASLGVAPYPLKVGSKGDNVKQLQIALNLHQSNTAKLKVDGDFGALTLAKLQEITGKSQVDSKAEITAWTAAWSALPNPAGAGGNQFVAGALGGLLS